MSHSDDFNQQCLQAHNILRSLHEDTEPLELDETLSNEAQAYAEKLASLGRLDEDKEHPHYGQNFNMLSNTMPNFNPSGIYTTLNWYRQIGSYQFDGQVKEKTGNFTQLIWRSTKKCGFGKAKNERGKFYLVGFYLPAGNVVNQVEGNVMKPKQGSSESWKDIDVFRRELSKMPENQTGLRKHYNDVMKKSSTTTVTTGNQVCKTITETYVDENNEEYTVSKTFEEELAPEPSNPLRQDDANNFGKGLVECEPGTNEESENNGEIGTQNLETGTRSDQPRPSLSQNKDFAASDQNAQVGLEQAPSSQFQEVYEGNYYDDYGEFEGDEEEMEPALPASEN